MKNFIFIIGIILISNITYSQQLLSTINPFMFEGGILYNQPINDEISIYVNYNSSIVRHINNLTPHKKYSIGLGREINNVYWLLGFNYHLYDNLNYSQYYPNSVEIGFIATPKGFNNTSISFITDPLNWITYIGIGYNFKKKEYD